MRVLPTTPEWKQAIKTQSSLSLLGVLLLICLGAVAVEAQTAAVDPNRSFPFTGVITATDVHVRSGPGTHTYRCAKLNQGDTVLVLGERQGWSKIVPPPGCFSWIAMQYVKLNVSDPSLAVITGTKATVYAGSELVEPMHSTSEQGSLTRGAKVRLLNEEKDGYFKIVPPRGSFLWVSSLYVKPMDEAVRAAVPAGTTTAPVVTPMAGPVVTTLPAGTETVVMQPETPGNPALQACRDIEARTLVEVAKPLTEQDYTEIKKELSVLAQDKEADDVQRYVKHLMNNIERYELASESVSFLAEQDKSLNTVLQDIEAARVKRLQEVQNTGQYAVIGTFRPSSVYKTAQVRRYRITDVKGRTICYAEAAEGLQDKDLRAHVGKKVGLVGKIKPHSATAGALVEFTKVVELP